MITIALGFLQTFDGGVEVGRIGGVLLNKLDSTEVLRRHTHDCLAVSVAEFSNDLFILAVSNPSLRNVPEVDESSLMDVTSVLEDQGSTHDSSVHNPASAPAIREAKG